jgi:branched-chain amino acid transport system permease protein
MTVLRRTPWLLIVFIAALYVPWLGSRFYTFLATQITILALFAVSLNLLLGYTGLVSFGHAAYFGIGAYTCAILMKSYGVPFLGAFAAAGVMAASFGLVFGFFCVRLTRIYFAMLTLAFAQIVWAICFKWNDVTGGEQGLSNVPYPELDWLSSLPGSAACGPASCSISWRSRWRQSPSRYCAESSSHRSAGC